MAIALQRAAGVAGKEQRAALVVVQVRVAHGRAVDDERVVEHVAVAIGNGLQLGQQVRHQADVVAIDLLEVGDALVAIEVMRAGVERGGRAAAREHAVRDVAAELEREDARRVGGKRHRLQVEHQLDVFLEGIGHANGRTRQFTRLARLVATLDFLNAPLNFANILQVVSEAGAVRGTEPLAQVGD